MGGFLVDKNKKWVYYPELTKRRRPKRLSFYFSTVPLGGQSYTIKGITPMRFSEAIPKFTAWKKYGSKETTAYTYELNIKQFALYVRNIPIEDVKYEDVVAFLDTMTELGWDKNSYMGKCMALRKFFEFFGKQIKCLDYELIPIPDRQYKFPKVLSISDYKALHAHIPTQGTQTSTYARNRLVISLLWDCGLRVGELTSINIEDVDTAKMQAIIKTEKSKGLKPARQVMWTQETNKLMIDWLKHRKRLGNSIVECDPKALLIGLKNKGSGRRLDKKGIEEMLRKLSNKAGLKVSANPHSFRHAFGRDLASKGANNSVISSLMGHANVQSSYVYTVLDDKLMAEQYEKYRRIPQ